VNDVAGLRPILATLTWILAAIVFFLMAVTFFDVLGRELFGLPVPAAFEFTRLALGLLVFVALPLVSANDEHVSIGLINGWFKGRAANRKQFVVSLFVAFLCAVLARELWVQAAALSQQNERLMFLQIKLAPFVYLMSALTLIAAIVHVVQAWLKLSGRFRPPEITGV
jgi:TRAP-type C4-dicarboxylate transport system permease small subunit